MQECEALAVRIRDGLLPLPQGTSLKAIVDTAEDLAIQIADIQQQLQQQQQQQQRVPGSQSEAKSLIPSTTSSFDSPVLSTKDPVRRVAVSATEGVSRGPTELEGHTPKKRRIDLRAVQQHQQQATAARDSNTKQTTTTTPPETGSAEATAAPSAPGTSAAASPEAATEEGRGVMTSESGSVQETKKQGGTALLSA